MRPRGSFSNFLVAYSAFPTDGCYHRAEFVRKRLDWIVGRRSGPDCALQMSRPIPVLGTSVSKNSRALSVPEC